MSCLNKNLDLGDGFSLGRKLAGAGLICVVGVLGGHLQTVSKYWIYWKFTSSALGTGSFGWVEEEACNVTGAGDGWRQGCAPFCLSPYQGCILKSSEINCGSEPVWRVRVPAPHGSVRLWGTSGDGHSSPNIWSFLSWWTGNARGWRVVFPTCLVGPHMTISSSSGWWLPKVVRNLKGQKKSERFWGLGKCFSYTEPFASLIEPWG